MTVNGLNKNFITILRDLEKRKCIGVEGNTVKVV